MAHLAHEAAQRHGLSQAAADRLVCLAWYEATNKPHATSGQYRGLMQFGPVLWNAYAPGLGYGRHASGAPYDPYAAIDTAAYVVARTHRWNHWGPVVKGLC